MLKEIRANLMKLHAKCAVSVLSTSYLLFYVKDINALCYRDTY